MKCVGIMMKQKKDKIRFILIFISISLVIGAFYVQVKLTSSQNGHQSITNDYNLNYIEPHVATYIDNQKKAWVALTKVEDDVPYLILYQVKNDGEFQVEAFESIRRPIYDMFFESDRLRLWYKSDSGWIVLNKDLEEINDEQTLREQSNQTLFLNTIQTVDEKYMTSFIEGEQIIGSHTFLKKPKDAAILNKDRKLILVIFENFETILLELTKNSQKQ